MLKCYVFFPFTSFTGQECFNKHTSTVFPHSFRNQFDGFKWLISVMSFVFNIHSKYDCT